MVDTDYATRLRMAMGVPERAPVPPDKRAALAKHLDVSVQAVNKIFAGGTNALTAVNNAKAARFYGVSSDWLATGEGSPALAVAVVKGPRAGSPSPKVDFEAKEVSQSEWALLEDLRVMPEDEMQAIRERAAKNKAHVDKIIAQQQLGARGVQVGAEPAKKRGTK